MAVKNYAELIAAAKGYARRDDITDDAWNLLLRNAEARIYRTLRVPIMEEVIFREAANEITLPNDLLEIKQIWIEDCGIITRVDETTRQMAIKRKPSEEGLPRYFSRVGNLLRFWPLPQGVEIQISYYAEEPGLNEDNQFSTLLNIGFDMFLFGILVEISSFTEYHEMHPVWEQRFQTAMSEIQAMAYDAEFAGSIKQEEILDTDVGQY